MLPHLLYSHTITHDSEGPSFLSAILIDGLRTLRFDLLKISAMTPAVGKVNAQHILLHKIHYLYLRIYYSHLVLEANMTGCAA